MSIIESIRYQKHDFKDKDSGSEEIYSAIGYNGEVIGNLWVQSGQKPVWITDISVEERWQHRGVGKALMQELASKLGPGVEVWGSIEHEESRLYLEENGYIDKAKSDPNFVINDPDKLNSIPIVRFRNHSGFPVERIEFEIDEKYGTVFALMVSITK
jgi:GNAT superfamily N-acetyltransferase